MKVRCSAATDVGRKREINQDAYGLSEPQDNQRGGYLLVVCDGMGGHASGEIASREGVDTIKQWYAESPDDGDIGEVLEQAFFEANRRIYNQGQGTMGTTGVAALLVDDRLYIANVGDSRAYLVRGDRIQQLSRDHSLVAEQVTAGLITAEQARHSNYRNMITRALGYRIEVQVDVFDPLTMHPGDIVILSSDGLHGLVDDAEIAQVVTSSTPDEAVQTLIGMANERGGTDNITAAIAVIDAVEHGEDSETTADEATDMADDETKPRRIAATTIRLDDDDSSSYVTMRLSPSSSGGMAEAAKSAPASEPRRAPGTIPPPRWNIGAIGIISTLFVVVVLGTVAFIIPDSLFFLPPRPASSPESPIQNGVSETIPSRTLGTPTVRGSTVITSPMATATLTPTNTERMPPMTSIPTTGTPKPNSP